MRRLNLPFIEPKFRKSLRVWLEATCALGSRQTIQSAHEEGDFNSSARFYSGLPILGVDFEVLSPVKDCEMSSLNLAQPWKYPGTVFYVKNPDEILKHPLDGSFRT